MEEDEESTLKISAGQWGCDEQAFAALEEKLKKKETVRVKTTIHEAIIWCGVKNWPHVLQYLLGVAEDGDIQEYDWERLVNYAASEGSLEALQVALSDKRLKVADEGDFAKKLAKQKKHSKCEEALNERFK